MSDITNAEGLRSPLRYFNPRGQGGAVNIVGGTSPHYLDGCFSMEIEGIRVIDPEYTNGSGFSSDNNDPQDLPTAAAGTKKRLVGTGGVAGFVGQLAGTSGVIRLQTGAAAANASVAFRAYPDVAGAVTTDTGPPVAYTPSTAAAGVTPNGKRLWYTTRIEIPSAGGSVLNKGARAFGLGIQSSLQGATTAITNIPTKGLWFNKSDTNTTVDFKIGGAAVSTALTDIHTLAGVTALALDTFFEYSYSIDVVGNITVYVNGKIAGVVTAGTTNLPTAATNLTSFLAVDNGASANTAQKVDQDYYLCCNEV